MIRTPFPPAVILLAMGLWTSSLIPVCSANPVMQASVDPGVDVSLEASPWYDPESGSIRPIALEPDDDDSLNRSSRWLPKPEKVRKVAAPASTTGGAGNGWFGSGLTLMNLLGWLLLLVLFIGGIAAIMFGLSKAEFELAGAAANSKAITQPSMDEQTIERMKQLPPELRRSGINLRSEAERLMHEGAYDQAIILLFGHQLLLLDRRGELRLNRGKTNRRYLRECQSSSAENAACLQETIGAFERSYFGRHQITEREFQSLWETNLKLERFLDASSEAAA